MHLLMRAGVTDPSYKVFPATRFLQYEAFQYEAFRLQGSPGGYRIGVGVGCCLLANWMLGVEKSAVFSLRFAVWLPTANSVCFVWRFVANSGVQCYKVL